MKPAITQTSNAMMKAVAHQMYTMFLGSMISYGVGTVVNNVLDFYF